MATCIACGVTLSPDDPPRFDVLSDDYDADDPTDVRGPYCEEHFSETQTGRIVASPPKPAPVAPSAPETSKPVDVGAEGWETR